MSAESLHLMDLNELRHERLLTKNIMEDNKRRMRGTATKERMELERKVEANRNRIEEINARIARLERVGRN